ncbi:ISAs1 family transposase, partial [Streptococcus sp. ZJ100]|uniref:ISAs1 family transposase n=1 Tax=Streptococcus handemini TaxID=3161188 RepID=UPI0032EE182C
LVMLSYWNQLAKKDQYYQTVEKAHGQIEVRDYWVSYDVKWLSERHPKWHKLRGIGMTKTTLDRDGELIEEVRYFIISFKKTIETVAQCVRGHWQIESMHWLLDIVFREDANKTLNKQLAFNLNVMDKFCLAVLKRLDFGKKMSMRRKKYVLSLSFDQYLKRLL